jgi:hypothetical protein
MDHVASGVTEVMKRLTTDHVLNSYPLKCLLQAPEPIIATNGDPLKVADATSSDGDGDTLGAWKRFTAYCILRWPHGVLFNSFIDMLLVVIFFRLLLSLQFHNTEDYDCSTRLLIQLIASDG